MGGRDHSICCPACGEWYSGFSGPDHCGCGISALTLRAEAIVVELAEAIWEHERSPETSIWFSFWDRLLEGGLDVAPPSWPPKGCDEEGWH